MKEIILSIFENSVVVSRVQQNISRSTGCPEKLSKVSTEKNLEVLSLEVKLQCF